MLEDKDREEEIIPISPVSHNQDEEQVVEGIYSSCL